MDWRLRLLGPALEAARIALRGMDEGGLSPRVRRIARHTGRRLPPPLGMSLVHVLDDEEWLRLRALEVWSEREGGSSQTAEEASEAFLRRGAEWEAVIEVARQRDGEATAGRSASRAEAEVERLRNQLDETRSRLEEASRELETLPGRIRADLSEELVRLARANERSRDRIGRLQAAVSRHQAEVRRLQGELASAGSKLREAKDRLHRRRIDEPGDPGGVNRFGGGTPEATSRMLDQIQHVLMIGSRIEGDHSTPDRPAIPSGLRPDRSEAILWLLDLDLPVEILVDGYNVVFEMGDEPDRSARRRVEEVVARICRLASGPMAAVVYWDSEEGESTYSYPRGIRVEYVASADDAIAAAARRRRRWVVAITGDREVREAVEEAGGWAVWSEALTRWAATASR